MRKGENTDEREAVRVALNRVAVALGKPLDSLTVHQAVRRRRRSRGGPKLGWFYDVAIQAAEGTRLVFRVFDNGDVEQL